MEFAVETRDLVKSYGDITAVNALNLQVESGAVHGFLGPNGAGKTTTIKILVGLLRPDSGSAYILGEEVIGDDPMVRQRVGYMPELPRFPRHLTGYELLDVYGRMYGLRSQQLRDAIPRLLDLVGLSDQGGRRIGEYSKGMQQRLGIAQALLNSPEVILLDEPTIGLDPVGMVEVRDLIQSIVKEGTTVFLSSHLLHEVQQICSHVTIINRGISIASGTLAEVTNKLTTTPILYVEVIGLHNALVDALHALTCVANVQREGQHLTITLNTSEDVRSQISQLITQQGGVIIQMIQRGNELEDVFLQLIIESESWNA
jgi:ABC-2 type transport system ATP-binding protein